MQFDYHPKTQSKASKLIFQIMKSNFLIKKKLICDFVMSQIFQKNVKMCHCLQMKVSQNINDQSWKFLKSWVINNNEFEWFPAWKLDKVVQLKFINMTLEMLKKWQKWVSQMCSGSIQKLHAIINNYFKCDFRLDNLTNLDN